MFPCLSYHHTGVVDPVYQARAVVTDGGGVLSHAAIIARENGIPAVMGTMDATWRLVDGQTVTVGGGSGVVEIVPVN